MSPEAGQLRPQTFLAAQDLLDLYRRLLIHRPPSALTTNLSAFTTNPGFLAAHHLQLGILRSPAHRPHSQPWRRLRHMRFVSLQQRRPPVT